MLLREVMGIYCENSKDVYAVRGQSVEFLSVTASLGYTYVVTNGLYKARASERLTSRERESDVVNSCQVCSAGREECRLPTSFPSACLYVSAWLPLDGFP